MKSPLGSLGVMLILFGILLLFAGLASGGDCPCQQGGPCICATCECDKSYGPAHRESVRSGKPLVYYVGGVQPLRLADCCEATGRSFNGRRYACVVVCRGGEVVATLPASATADQVHACLASQPTPQMAPQAYPQMYLQPTWYASQGAGQACAGGQCGQATGGGRASRRR